MFHPLQTTMPYRSQRTYWKNIELPQFSLHQGITLTWGRPLWIYCFFLMIFPFQEYIWHLEPGKVESGKGKCSYDPKLNSVSALISEYHHPSHTWPHGWRCPRNVPVSVHSSSPSLSPWLSQWLWRSLRPCPLCTPTFISHCYKWPPPLFQFLGGQLLNVCIA